MGKMETQPAMMVAYDPNTIDRLVAEIAALRAEIRGATIVPAPEWCGVSDAARRLGVSAATIRRKISLGQIEARGAGKTRQVRI